jgi:hypothetical protein
MLSVMARPMIAYCGIDCASCPAYRFPRLGEKLHMKGLFQAMLKRGMKSKGLAMPDGDVICDGCTTIDARCLKPCLECAVRCCAMETGIENCAHCPKYPCDRLRGVWQITVFKDAQPRLEKLHAARKAGQAQASRK